MIKLSDILDSKDSYYRINFFNTLSGLRSVWMAGSQNNEGIKNLGLFNSIVHVGSNPPLIGIVFRPQTVPRHTLENIYSCGYFTLNSITQDMIDLAHRTSEKFAVHEDEFNILGFTPFYFEERPDVPAVAESPIKILLRFRENHLITSNQTIFIVSEIMNVVLSDEEGINADGSINHDFYNHAVISGLNDYYAIEFQKSMFDKRK